MQRPLINRIDFLLIFDVKDGNPNGDPEFNNSPRIDPETLHGLVSDVCLKRKVRNWVYMAKSQGGVVEPGYDIFVQQGQALESRQKLPFQHLDELANKAKGKQTARPDIERARSWMCDTYYDIRAFGAVMNTTDFNCGQVRGPVQLTFARSFHRILFSDHVITRVAYTREEKSSGKSAEIEIGHKFTVAYGLYAAYGFITPAFAGGKSGTGFNENDLDVFQRALVNMFDLDHSAAHGLMRTRHIFAFEHASALGVAPAGKLFDLVKVELQRHVDSPRAYEDYSISSIDNIRAACPKGVTATDWASRQSADMTG